MRVRDFKTHLKVIYPNAAHLFDEARTERELMVIVNTIKLMEKTPAQPETPAEVKPASVPSVPASPLYDVILTEGGSVENRVSVIKEVRHITSFGLKHAKDIVDDTVAGKPGQIAIRVSFERAKEIVALVSQAGGLAKFQTAVAESSGSFTRF